MRYQIARIFDFEMNSDFVCELKHITHKGVFNADRPFKHFCLFCKSADVRAIEETIQYGMLVDKHFVLCYCLACLRASFHTYELAD
jgi:hypothetical protein